MMGSVSTSSTALANIYYVSGALPSLWYVLINLTLLTALWGRSYHCPCATDEETEAQRSEVTKQVGEAWMASGLRWGPKNRKVVHHTLNSSCKGSPWGAEWEAHLAETQNLRVKRNLHTTRYSTCTGEKTGAGVWTGKAMCPGPHRDLAAESNREPGALADQSLCFPWVSDPSRDHR